MRPASISRFAWRTFTALHLLRGFRGVNRIV